MQLRIYSYASMTADCMNFLPHCGKRFGTPHTRIHTHRHFLCNEHWWESTVPTRSHEAPNVGSAAACIDAWFLLLGSSPLMPYSMYPEISNYVEGLKCTNMVYGIKLKEMGRKSGKEGAGWESRRYGSENDCFWVGRSVSVIVWWIVVCFDRCFFWIFIFLLPLIFVFAPLGVKVYLLTYLKFVEPFRGEEGELARLGACEAMVGAGPSIGCYFGIQWWLADGIRWGEMSFLEIQYLLSYLHRLLHAFKRWVQI